MLRGLLRLVHSKLGLALCLALCCASCARSSYPSSDHFDGASFHNPNGGSAKGLAALIRWKLTSSGRADWKPQPDAPFGRKPPTAVGAGELHVTFINHATVLLQFDGTNVLTDPIWSERSSPFSWVGPKRVRPPGLRFEDLPPIDLVVVSHDHYDHCDLATLRRLAQAHHPRFLVPLALAALLRNEGIPDVHERDWWQSLALDAHTRAWVVPAQHFGARSPFDSNERLWAGFVFETRAGPVFFAGDTGMSDHFVQIRKRFGPMLLAVLPIGAYMPRWFMEPIHLDPTQAVQAHRLLQADVSVAMHFGTFQLADEAENAAQNELRAAVERAPLPRPEFWVLEFGEGRYVVRM